MELGLGISYATIDRDYLPQFKHRKLEFIPFGHHFKPEHIVVIYRMDREESFFKTLKVELIYQRHYKRRSDAKLEIFEYIEVFYNRLRLHSALGYESPADFERSYENRSKVA